jgi:hypothetical protein
MDKSYKIPGYGQQIRSNFKAALRAYKPHMPFTTWGFIRRTNIFVPARGSAELPDPGPSDDEDEARIAKPTEVEEEPDEQNANLRNATDTQESPLQDVPDESSDTEMNDGKADQQGDLEDSEVFNENLGNEDVAERDPENREGDNENLEDEEAANEILEAGETSTDGLDEDSDGDITHEIRIEGPGGTLRELKEVTIILKF